MYHENCLVIFSIIVFCFVGCKQKTPATNTIILDSSQGTNKVIKKDSSSNALVFHKVLNLQNISYQLSAIGNGSIQKLVIVPIGFTSIMDTITMTSDPVVGAEIEDLDHDGYPELLIYTQSAGSGSYGHVLGFSPNKGKSISPIYFPELGPNSTEAKGYKGHDEFSIVESSLARRFPCFESTDTNAKSTGKLRQLQYKLKNGEASKKFVLVGSVEFAK